VNAILIIEDEALDTDYLRSSLLRLGVGNPIRVVVDCEEAVKYLEGQGEYGNRGLHPQPAVIFLDMRMPGMDGFAFLEWLKSHSEFRDIFVFAVSGTDDLLGIRRAYRLGVNSFLTKPCRPADLENLIQGYPGPWLRS